MSKVEYYEQKGVAMTCRSFKEYEQMFMLGERHLGKGKILDVASGGSSFTAELRRRGYDAVCADPLYSLSGKEMEELGKREIKSAAEKLARNKHLFVWDSYESLQSHESIRRTSFQDFTVDYVKDERKETYIPASLPVLPFDDNTFSLIVCNHFLFLYQEQFDFDFHLKAINELIRVVNKGGEIRIYPLVGFKNEQYPYLEQLIRAAAAKGTECQLEETDFRFLPSAIHFLRMKK